MHGHLNINLSRCTATWTSNSTYWCTLVQPSLQWTSNKYHIFWVCVCILAVVSRHSIRNRRIMLPSVPNLALPIFSFPHYLINGATFAKKLLNPKCVFWFSLQLFFLKHFSFYKEFSAIFSYTYLRLHIKCPLFLSDFIDTLNLYRLIFEKKIYSIIKLHENQSCVSRVLPRGRTNGHWRSYNCRFSANFCERAWKRVTNINN